MAQTVVGIFDSANEAQNAVDQLIDAGFMRNNIDISARTASDADTTTRRYDNDGDDSVSDGIGDFFRNLFGGSDDADRYSNVARRGSVVTVHTDTIQEAERAADILDQYGAVDVNDRDTQYRSADYGTTTSDLSTASAAYTDTAYTRDDLADRTVTDNPDSLKVIEEDLQVGKRTVETGGVRLRSRIVEKPVEEHLRLRVERVHVNRNPVNRPATAADLNNFQEGTVEMTERAEVPVVNKEARVVEEISLSKDVEERDEVIRDTVRRTDVDVEDLRTDADRTTLRDRDDDLNRPANL